MRRINFSLLLVIVLFAPALRAQVLWQGTAYGMSRAEVQAAVPNTSVPSNPARSKSGALVELLRVSHIDLVNNKFQASFIFRDEKLIYVTLELEDAVTPQAAVWAFNGLTTALKMKYGAETSRKSDRSSLMQSDSVQWLSGRTTIDLNLRIIGDRGWVNVYYSGRLGPDADKL